MIKNGTQGERDNKSKEETGKQEFLFLVLELLANLPERSQQIVKKRYGIGFDKGKTLEEIGREYGITRERVRQIIEDARKNVAKRITEEKFKSWEDKLILEIIQNNDIIKESEIVNRNNPSEGNALRFFAYCSSKIVVLEEKGIIEKCWVLSKNLKQELVRVGQEAENVFKKVKRTLTSEEIINETVRKFPHLKPGQIVNFLSCSVPIKQNRFGKWGLFNWPEINPKGTREKIYLVLKEENRPLHFTDIAELIDKYQLGRRKAHPQTVHNELIKDNRFVLIGRGIYALRKWGYSEGTVKDVLMEIFKRSSSPLTKEEILTKVLKVRKVKKTTVVINLNNSKTFVRQQGMYSLKN